MKKTELLFLSSDDVRQALPMKDAIEAMRDGFVSLSNNEAIVPQRIHTVMEKYNSMALFMPVYLPSQNLAAVKLVTVANDNSKRNLPLIHGLVMVVEASTGLPKAVIDGAALTAIRTGAASGLATELLARKDSKAVAIFGGGIQGRTQLEAVAEVRKIERAIIFDPDNNNADKFVSDMAGKLGVSISVGQSMNELKEVDVICTATTSPKPVFDDQYIADGTHINAVGSYQLKMREIPAETVLRSKVIVDSVDACLAEAGEFLINLDDKRQPKDLIHAELGQIVSSEISGRTGESEISLFKSVGNAVQDLAAAAKALENAQAMKIGQNVTL